MFIIVHHLELNDLKESCQEATALRGVKGREGFISSNESFLFLQVLKGDRRTPLHFAQRTDEITL